METENTPVHSGLSEDASYRIRFNSGFDFNYFSQTLSLATRGSVKLSHKEFQCLAILDHGYPDKVPLEVFLNEIWLQCSLASKSLDVLIFRLRKKLRPFGFRVVHEQNSYALVYQLSHLEVVDPSRK